MTQQLADAYAEGIAARPEDWHMLQRFWPADLPQATAASAGDGLADAAAPADAQPKTTR
jgi:KDO2-lipid IV(A) lauroyltransferase